MEKSGKRLPARRVIKDALGIGSTYFSSTISVIALIAMIVFVFLRGSKTLRWSFITGDYASEVVSVKTSTTIAPTHNTFDYQPVKDERFSEKWGIAFRGEKNNEGTPIVTISHIEENANISCWIDASTEKPLLLSKGMTLNAVCLWTTNDPETASVVVPDVKDVDSVVSAFDRCDYLMSMTVSEGGMGMRGSLLTTLYLILFSIAIALPLGIGAAVYLGIYAKDNGVTRFLRAAIDMISGIPSIVFGLVGGAIFLPITAGHTSILAGSFTLACMVLPIIIKTTEESIRAIPRGMTLSSLALGASQNQTTFKIVLPNAIPGILTSALLAIGRVIGESAALIYTSGVIIKDYIVPTQGSASMAVHIWYLMSGEHQNYEASCAVAIVILIVVLILNLLLKWISHRINRRKEGK